MEVIDDKLLHPKVVHDINYWILFSYKDRNIYCVGSIEKDKYLEVPQVALKGVLAVIKYFDGNHSLAEVSSILLKENIKIDVEGLYNILYKANLILDADESSIEKQELDILSVSLIEISLKKSYNFLQSLCKFVFPYYIYISIPIIIIGMLIMANSFRVFYSYNSYKISGSYVLGILIMFFSFALCIMLHELSHAVTSYKYGLKPLKVVISLYLGSIPMVYLKIPGIYTLKPKNRIYIWLAGIYTNLFLGSCFVIAYKFTNGNLQKIMILFAITNIFSVMPNLSPLMPLDGYFIISTLLKKSNLRKGSFKEFKKWALRKQNNFRRLYVLYFMLSGAFIMIVTGSQIYWIIAAIIDSTKRENLFYTLIHTKIVIFIPIIIVLKKIITSFLKKKSEGRLR